MGSLYIINCKCGYTAQVSGSHENMNMLGGTSTVVCLDCKVLEERSTWGNRKSLEERSKMDRASKYSDYFTFEMPSSCRSFPNVFAKDPVHRVMLWKFGDPCPKCNEIINKKDATMFALTD